MKMLETTDLLNEKVIDCLRKFFKSEKLRKCFDAEVMSIDGSPDLNRIGLYVELQMPRLRFYTEVSKDVIEDGDEWIEPTIRTLISGMVLPYKNRAVIIERQWDRMKSDIKKALDIT
jgi:hypothetical protein